MTDREKLQSDIDALLETIQREYAGLGRADVPAAERAATRRRIDWCIKELSKLLAQLEGATPTAP